MLTLQATLLMITCLLQPCAESSSFGKLKQAWGAGSTVQLDVQDSKQAASAGSLLQAASDVVAANPRASVTVLDHSTLQVGGCLRTGLVLAFSHCQPFRSAAALTCVKQQVVAAACTAEATA